MKLNEIRDNEGAAKTRKRVGRGIGSGKGKTAGRGVKGQKARSGVAVNGFEGGQMPLYRRLPKRGFSNAMFAGDYNTVSLGRVQIAVDAGKLDAKAPVTVEALVAARVLRRAKDGVRLLSDGDIKAKLAFEVAHASKAALEKVEKAGGTVKILAFAADEKAEQGPFVTGSALECFAVSRKTSAETAFVSGIGQIGMLKRWQRAKAVHTFA